MKKTIVLVLFLIFLLSQTTLAMEDKNIEIFDPLKDRVIKSIPLDDEISTMIIDWFSSVDEIYPRANIFDDEGYVIRFPFGSSQRVKNQFIDLEIDEVYLLLPETEDPFFMILSKENQPLCFTFSGDLDQLSKILDFNLK